MAVGQTGTELKLGILLDSNSISKYSARLINFCQSHQGLKLTLILVASEQSGDKHSLPPDAKNISTAPSESSIRQAVFGLVTIVEKVLLLKNKDHYDHLRKFDLSSFKLQDIVRQYRRDDLPSLKALGLDLIIALSSSSASEDLATVTRLGVLSLTLSDDRIYRDGPAGFWEVYNRDDVTGFSIELRTPVEPASRTFLRGRVVTQFYYLLNQASLFQKAHYYVERFLDTVALTNSLPRPLPQLPFYRRRVGIPNTCQTLGYLVGLTRLTASKLLHKAGAENQWHVAFVRSQWCTAELERATTIANPPGHYLADPFVVTVDGKDFCFVEDYDARAKRGEIAVYELGKEQATRVGVALREPFHLSYPYLFQYQGQLYMCPETSEAREIRVYKCLEFPLRWTPHKILMTDVSAVDTMLFEHHGKWWMLTNVDPDRWDDFSLELCIFSANSPLDQDWTPHPGNPHLVDASCTRNGGMINDRGRLYRVAQKQGFMTYGKQTSVNEIVTLNEKDYVERRICEISPDFRKGLSGTHHFHSNGAVTVFDFALPFGRRP